VKIPVSEKIRIIYFIFFFFFFFFLLLSNIRPVACYGAIFSSHLCTGHPSFWLIA
jgi:hypothetical protein